jgi:predicted nuclease of predicted toxin-antitoxin system
LRPRFLIDENLSVALSEAAHAAGFEAMHVVHLGLASERDWVPKPMAWQPILRHLL